MGSECPLLLRCLSTPRIAVLDFQDRIQVSKRVSSADFSNTSSYYLTIKGLGS